MVKILKDLGCDWAVNSDVDEFWLGDIRKEIEMSSNENYNSILVNSLTFLSTYLDDVNEINPILRHIWRSTEYDLWPKIICSTENFIRIGNGNDEVFFECETRNVLSSQLIIYHYSNRGYDQCYRKYVNGGKAILNSRKTETPCPSMWLKHYESYLNGGDTEFKSHYENEIRINGNRIDLFVRDTTFAEYWEKHKK
jgi:hypothetical protein